MKSNIDPAAILRKAGYRATPGRIKLLEMLEKATQPLTVAQIHAKVGSKELNEVTLYRALEALAASGIVRRVDLQQGHAHHYELVGTHHHHIVCTDCGTVEDFSDKLCDSVVEKATKKSSSFKIITSHSMELFGVCANCS
jgi:Fur family ferric uptake transcriptional regulator